VGHNEEIIDSRINLVKGENDHLLAKSHNVLNKLKKYVSVLNVREINDARQTVIHFVTCRGCVTIRRGFGMDDWIY
jgi:hypothetical protein